MQEIKKLVQVIDDEIEGAEEYLDLAEEFKTTHPDVSNILHSIGLEEINHVQKLHDGVVILINKQKTPPPEYMLKMWEYLHAKYMNKLRKLKWCYAEFKK